MEVSGQIIKVLDNLCEKFGLAIDWSQNNVLPYLQELGQKIVNYDIAMSIFYIIISLIILGISYKLFKSLLLANKNIDNNEYTSILKDSLENEYVLYVFCWIIVIISYIAGIIMLLHNMQSLIQDIYIPEKTIFNLINSTLNSTK